MCRHLNRTGPYYYFRRPVPKGLIGYFRTESGKTRTEWKVTLGVTDREVAKTLIPPHQIETDLLIAEAKRELIGATTAYRLPIVRYPAVAADEMERDSLEAAEFRYSENEEQ